MEPSWLCSRRQVKPRLIMPMTTSGEHYTQALLFFTLSKVKREGKFLYSTISYPQDSSEHLTLYSLAEQFNQTPFCFVLGSIEIYMLLLMWEDYSYRIQTQVLFVESLQYHWATQHMSRLSFLSIGDTHQILQRLDIENMFENSTSKTCRQCWK